MSSLWPFRQWYTWDTTWTIVVTTQDCCCMFYPLYYSSLWKGSLFLSLSLSLSLPLPPSLPPSPPSLSLSLTHTHTHSHTRSLTRSLTHSLTHLHSLTHSNYQPLLPLLPSAHYIHTFISLCRKLNKNFPFNWYTAPLLFVHSLKWPQTFFFIPTGWPYSAGFISDTMIREHMPAPGPDVQILMCGPPPMINYACIPNLEKLGYTGAMYFPFWNLTVTSRSYLYVKPEFLSTNQNYWDITTYAINMELLCY